MSENSFQMDDGWLVYHPDPSKPDFPVPEGAVDAHCHVFGPGEIFPYAPARKYTPCDASKEKLWALRDHLGFERNVIVQATCHGADNRALVDALEDSLGRARGVATVTRDIRDDELQKLHTAGVRGVRFNFVKRLVDVLPRDTLVEMAERLKPFGWHLVIYVESQDLPELSDFFASLPGTIVFDHMARPDVSKAVEGAPSPGRAVSSSSASSATGVRSESARRTSSCTSRSRPRKSSNACSAVSMSKSPRRTRRSVNRLRTERCPSIRE